MIRQFIPCGVSATVAALAVTSAVAMADTAPAIAAYGTWQSPVSAQSLAESAVRMSYLRISGTTLYWNENRPTEKGRRVVMSDAGDEAREVTPVGFDVRTRVHEYGGISYIATQDAVYFSNFADQRLYEQRGKDSPRVLTPAGYRYADCVANPANDTLVCVREDHTAAAGEVKNAIVAVKRSGGDAGTVLFGSSDFVAYPRVSRDGKKLAWIAWNHPDMPWDATMLHVAELSADGVKGSRVIAGGDHESVMEPQWDIDGSLYFISDRNDFWNLFVWRENQARAVIEMKAEFAAPLWWLGQSNYALTGDGFAVARYGTDMVDHLAMIDLKRGTLREIRLPFVGYDSVQLLGSDHAAMIATSADQMPAIISVDLRTGAVKRLRQPTATSLEVALISRAEEIQFPTSGGHLAHAFYYPPHNSKFSAPAGELPPLIVAAHGGPTIGTSPELKPNIQYWTSRGFAIVEVNYGGSAGYGRAYRERLRGKWGIVDVQDVIAAAEFLGKQRKADPERLIIRGGSAGGYTVLAALSQTDVFRTGTNSFGLSDLAAFVRDTHKFESRYLDGLIAPYPAGEAVYAARSPLAHLSGFKVPLLVLQGADDPIVLPNQSRMIVDALRKRGLPVAYLEFAGEGHGGFRQRENIIRATEAELSFYGRVLGFAPSDYLPALQIENADALRKD